MIPTPVECASVVDAGCGFGDLYNFFTPKPKRYIGMDALLPMVEEARVRTRQTILHKNVLSDTLIRADYYLCSGALNVMSRFERLLFIERALAHARRGFVFNALFGSRSSSIYNYFTHEDIVAIAKRAGVKCRIKTGYLPHDITVGLYR